MEKGTTNGTTTDVDGRFTLNVKAGGTLEIKYLGYKSAEVRVLSESISVKLEQDNKVLNEVVVTALGIKRDRKALGYGLEEVKGGVFEKAKETNVINSLAGRVAGLVVSQTAGGGYRDWETDRKSTRLNSSHSGESRMPSSA